MSKNKPTIEQLEKYISEFSYGFDFGMENYESKYRDKKMITAGNKDNFVLTSYGEMILKTIKRKNRKEWIQTWVPTGALIITTITLVFSTMINF